MNDRFKCSYADFTSIKWGFVEVNVVICYEKERIICFCNNFKVVKKNNI